MTPISGEDGQMKSMWIAALLLLSTNAFAQMVQIRSVEYSGSGCPQGSVQVQFSPDGSSFTVLYDRFDLRVGADIAEGMQNCSIRVKVKKPLLAAFRVESADFRGFVHLDPGVTAEQKVSVAVGPIKELRRITSEFGYQRWQGPIAQNFLLTTVRPLNTPPVLDCVPPRENTEMIIESKIRVGRGGGSRFGQLTVDSADGRMVQRYNLKWQNCVQSGIDLIRLLGRR